MSKKILIINPDNYMEMPFEQQLTVGRDVYNSLCLQDAEISRSHAILFEQGEQTIVKDLNSHNGVFVNGDKVLEQIVQAGDEIILGTTIIFYEPPEGMDLERRLSSRGEYLFEKMSGRKPGRTGETLNVFTVDQLEEIVDKIFSQEENTSYFTLTNAMSLMKAFYEMGHAASSADLFRVTLRHAMELIGGDQAVIMEADKSKEKLKVRSILAAHSEDSEIEMSQQVLRVVLRAERGVFCPDVANDTRFSKVGTGARRPIHSFAAAPIVYGKNYFGFMYLHHESGDHEFDFTDLRSLYLLASHLAALLQPRPTHFEHNPELDAREAAGLVS